MIDNRDKLYVVTMYRWGDKECHSYLWGVFTDKDKAIEEGYEEMRSRGNKYEPEVVEVRPDSVSNRKIILKVNQYS